MVGPIIDGGIGDPGNSDLLYLIASELNEAVIECLQDDGLDIPATVFVDMVGVTAPVGFDGECNSQLSTVVSQIHPGLPTQLMQRRAGRSDCALLWEAMFEISLLRCVPLNETGYPDPDVIDEQGHLHLQDGWQMARCLGQKWHEGLLVPSFKLDCENVQWFPLKPLAPRGGIRGWTLSVSTSVHSHWQPEIEGV